MIFPFYFQQDAMDCGPTCLRMIAKYYGKTIGINTLRNQSQYSRGGVSILGISKAAENIGFKTLGININPKDLLQNAPLPCILHWNQNHFVILVKSNKNKFIIADPAKGIIKLSEKEFLKNWISLASSYEQKGIALLIEPTPLFFKQDNEKKQRYWLGNAYKIYFKI